MINRNKKGNAYTQEFKELMVLAFKKLDYSNSSFAKQANIDPQTLKAWVQEDSVKLEQERKKQEDRNKLESMLGMSIDEIRELVA